MKKRSLCGEVKSFYPDAKAINIGTKSGDKFYEIHNEVKNVFGDLITFERLGRGKSAKAAWKSAYRNIQ